MLLAHLINSFRSPGAVQRLSGKGLLAADTIVQTDEANLANLLYPVYFSSFLS